MTAQFTGDDWYEIRGRGWVACIAGIDGFDPRPLTGQRVTIDDKDYRQGRGDVRDT